MQTTSDWMFVRRVLIVIGLTALCFALWKLSDLLLIVFAAVLAALAMRDLSAPIMRVTGAGRSLALGIVIVGIAAFIGLLIVFVGPSLYEQAAYLADTLPGAFEDIASSLRLEQIAEEIGGTAFGALASSAMSIGTTLMAALAGVVLVMAGGIYLASAPASYRRGLIAVIPQRWQGAISSTLDDSGFALSRWLKAQLIAMAIVGILTGVGMWLIGVPSPLALGVIAGVFEFIPIVGPIIGALPAVLLATSQGLELTLAAAAVALAIQQVENNAIMPLVIGRVVELPPAVGLFATVGMGLLFGPLGLLLGYPLAIVADVAIRRLYVREALGKPVAIPAERARTE
jgi:predicted PurR-regulated permease PerM